jgi:hypothetical protein
MIIFETKSGQKIKIINLEDEQQFEIAIQSENPNAHFNVGSKVYFVRCVDNFEPRIGRGRPCFKQKLF